MRHAIATSTGLWGRAGLGAALLLALLAPLSCANDVFTPDPPDPPVTPPPPPPPPPPAPPCNPVVQALRLERYGTPPALFEGREIAVLGADIGVAAIAQLSCAGGVLPSPNWSVDNLGVLQLTSAWLGYPGPGQATGGFTAVSPGQAVVTLEWGGRQASMAVEVPPSPAVGRFQQVSTGMGVACGVNEARQTFCWGSSGALLVSDNDSGATGNCPLQPGNRCRPVPLRRQLPVALDELTVGSSQVCGLVNGVAWCWGYSFQTEQPSPPQAVSGTAGLHSVSLGDRHGCGLNDQGTVFCWGINVYGQLGNGTTESSVLAMPVAEGRRFASIAAGRRSTCAVTQEGALFCWGDGAFGAGPSEECGIAGKNAPSPCRKVPTRVDPMLVGSDTVFRAVSMGEHACALSVTGRLYCWNGYPSTLGITSNSDRISNPAPVETSLRFDAISVRGSTTCALVPGGEAYCMAITIDPIADQFGPQPVPGGLRFRSISAGHRHACGIALNGYTYCWGNNRSGQLGAGHRTTSSTPILVLGQAP